MAYVRAHANGIYVAFKIRNERHTTTVPLRPTAANLRATRSLANDLEHRLRAGERWESVRADLRGEETPTVVGTLGYYAQHVLDVAEIERATVMAYQSLYNTYWLPFDQRPITSLRQTELQTHLATFSVGWKTRRNAVSFLRRCIDAARRDGVKFASIPTDDWEIRRGKVKSRQDPYDVKERDRLLAELHTMGQRREDDMIAYRYFYTGFFTGMRTGELLGLPWSNVEPGVIHVRQERVRREIELRTKTNVERDVVVPKHVVDVMESGGTRFDRSFVFLTPEHHAFRDADWLMERWSRAHKVAGIRKRTKPYPWRSTYVSIALSQGAPLLLVAKQTGHDPVTMSKHYAAYINDRGETREEIERIFG